MSERMTLKTTIKDKPTMIKQFKRSSAKRVSTINNPKMAQKGRQYKRRSQRGVTYFALRRAFFCDNSKIADSKYSAPKCWRSAHKMSKRGEKIIFVCSPYSFLMSVKISGEGSAVATVYFSPSRAMGIEACKKYF